MKSMQVCVVDDDPDFAEGITLMLELAGHEVTIARSGEEAVRMFAERPFDVTLMDIRMPGMNGHESLQAIRRIRPDARVIMMTAYSVEELVRHSLADGALGVLHKPIDSESLLTALKDANPAGVILVADDDPDFSQAMETTLTGAGYRVRIASSGPEAVELVLSESFDVLLLDLRMPVLGGLEVYRELLRHGRSLPTIVVTGFEEEEAESITQLRELSAKTCLVKPFGSEELLRAVGEFV